MATFLDLPLEVFRFIIEYAAQYRGLKRALRLRLVNKQFEYELFEALIPLKMMDECTSVNPFAEKYLVMRILKEKTDEYPILNNIRGVAQQLATGDVDSKYSDHVSRLAPLALARQAPRSIFRRELDDPFKPKLVGLPHIRTAPIPEDHFELDLLAASAFISQDLLVKENFPNAWYNRGREGLAFEQPNYAAMRGGRSEVALCCVPRKRGDMSTSCHSSHWAHENLLLRASELGNLHAVKLVLNSDWIRKRYWSSRTHSRIRPRGGLERRPKWFEDGWYRAERVLMTPSVQVLKTLVACRSIEKPGRLPQQLLYPLLGNAAKRGWIEMTKHLLTIGAPLEMPYPQGVLDEREWTRIFWSPMPERPIFAACEGGHYEIVELLLDPRRKDGKRDKWPTKGAHSAQLDGTEIRAAAAHGHISIVKMLLERGADVHCEGALGALSAAANKGYLEIVRMLLDAGQDPSGASGPRLPIVSVVALEHTEMFELLVERGADVIASDVHDEVMKVISEDGLESMSALWEGLTVK